MNTRLSQDEHGPFFSRGEDSLNDLDLQQEEGFEGANVRAGKEEAIAIASTESNAVRWIRLVAVAVIVLSTIGVALAVYYYMTSVERNAFKYRFASDSYKILESIGATFARSLGSVDAFAVSTVSAAKQSNQVWPYVTIPDFAVQSSKILTLSKGVWFNTYRYVSREQRPLWNNFTVHNDGWVNESLNVQEKALNKTYFGPINRNWTKADDVWYTTGAALETDFYLPSWQTYPNIPAGYPLYSYDLWEYPGLSAERMVETHQAAISYTYLVGDPNDPAEAEIEGTLAEYLRSYLPPGREPFEPICEIYYVS
jgi:hypothetical protein